MLLKTQVSVGLLKFLEPLRAVRENKIHQFTFDLGEIIHVIKDLKRMVTAVLLSCLLSTNLTSTFSQDIWKHSCSWHGGQQVSACAFVIGRC